MNFKKTSVIILLSLLYSTVFANSVHSIKVNQSLNVTTIVKPNDRQKYQNPTWLEVSAKCKVDTQQQNISLKLELSKGYAFINKTKYKAPTTLDNFSVADHDKFTIKVSKQAKMAITLLQTGDVKQIKAACSINL